MKTRGLVLSSVTTAAALASTILGVAPASAATSVAITTTLINSVTYFAASPATTTATTLNVTYTDSVGSFATVYFNSPFLSNGGTPCSTSNTTCQLTSGASLTLTVDPSTPTNTMAWVRYSTSNVTGIRLNFSGSSGSSSSANTPAPVLQQFGRPADRSCIDAAPTALNWANVSSGGWGESWSPWMNGGAGGFVCTRTLIYSTIQAAWVVA